MNESATDKLPVPRKPRRWLMWLLCAALFFCGIVCGAGGTAVVLLRAARNAAQHPERRPANIVRIMDKRLDLTRDQEEKALAILQKHQERLMALRAEVWPRVEQELKDADAEVRAILTPGQQARWQKMVDRIKAAWMPAAPR